MKRRSFLGLLGIAPAIITTPGLLMPIKPQLVPTLTEPMATAVKLLGVTPEIKGFDEGDFVGMNDQGAMGFLRGGKVVYEFVHDLTDGMTWDKMVERGAPGTAEKIADAFVIGRGEDDAWAHPATSYPQVAIGQFGTSEAEFKRRHATWLERTRGRTS